MFLLNFLVLTNLLTSTIVYFTIFFLILSFFSTVKLINQLLTLFFLFWLIFIIFINRSLVLFSILLLISEITTFLVLIILLFTFFWNSHYSSNTNVLFIFLAVTLFFITYQQPLVQTLFFQQSTLLWSSVLTYALFSNTFFILFITIILFLNYLIFTSSKKTQFSNQRHVLLDNTNLF